MDTELKPRRTRSGYTLIEVLVAAVILMIALPGLVVMLTGSRKTQVASLRMEQAMSFGQLVIDSLSLLPGSARAAGAQTVQTQYGSTLYSASWTLPAAAGGAFSFPVQVSWTQATKQHSVRLQAVIR